MIRPSDRSVPDADSDYFDTHWPRFLEEWKDLLRIPSISADPAFRGECRQCAQWLADHLAALGFESRLLTTASHPVVLARRAGDAALPAILFYGHYDVQPPDPLNEWETPPFEPELRDGRLYARGAQDNKGQVFAFIKALEALRRQQVPLPPLTLLLEGDEEDGSSALADCLETWRDDLAARVLLVSDTETAASGRPAIVMGLRGIVTLTVTVSGPHHDLHSGLHGGVAPNPAVGLARLIATLHDAEGRIAVSGFTDDVRIPDAEELRQAQAAQDINPAAYREQTGVDPVAGEPDVALFARLAFRPCIDVNGITSGYAGDGIKTIIPARATAKLSARLAAGQDPALALRRLSGHLRQHAPRGLTLTITDACVGGPALWVDWRSPVVTTARTVLHDLFGVEPAFLREGASIPVLSRLAQVSGAEPVLVGFGSSADRIHAPNESYRVAAFRDGFRFAARLLRELGRR